MREGHAFDDDACGFEVGDAVVGAVSHEDGFGQELDEGAGVFRKPSSGGLIPIDDEAVGGVALGADQLGFERTGKGTAGEFAYRVGARSDGCNPQIHCSEAITGIAVRSRGKKNAASGGAAFFSANLHNLCEGSIAEASCLVSLHPGWLSWFFYAPSCGPFWRFWLSCLAGGWLVPPLLEAPSEPLRHRAGLWVS